MNGKNAAKDLITAVPYYFSAYPGQRTAERAIPNMTRLPDGRGRSYKSATDGSSLDSGMSDTDVSPMLYHPIV